MTKQLNNPPTVIMFHARYRNLGGEEGSFKEEARLFEDMGYRVIKFEVSNASLGSNFCAGLSAIFNPTVFIRTLKMINDHSPSLLYVNNLWPALSPAVLWAARLKRIPTLQALRNYRIICPSAKLTNEGACLNCGSTTFPLRCIIHKCYNDSRAQTLLVALFSLSTRLANRGRRSHRYLATSNATKDLLSKAGLPSDKISVRSNFLNATLKPSFALGEGVTYVGRLSEEKGVSSLVSAWRATPSAPPLTLIGDGPLAELALASSSEEGSNVKWIGSRSTPDVLKILKSSTLTIVPSQWAEPFGRVAIESMSVGTPVMYTNGGALSEIVGESGVFLREISPAQLSAAFRILNDPAALAGLRRKAHARFQSTYSQVAAIQDMKGHIEAVVIS